MAIATIKCTVYVLPFGPFPSIWMRVGSKLTPLGYIVNNTGSITGVSDAINSIDEMGSSIQAGLSSLAIMDDGGY